MFVSLLNSSDSLSGASLFLGVVLRIFVCTLELVVIRQILRVHTVCLSLREQWRPAHLAFETLGTLCYVKPSSFSKVQKRLTSEQIRP